MKVLHVCHSDLDGGAARAAFRLNEAMYKSGLDSKMLVIDKQSDSYRVITPPRLIKFKTKIANKISNILLKYQKTTNVVHHSLNLFSSGVANTINALDVDVINLHWIHNEMLGIKELRYIKKPIIWTLHDMWAFCGTEHYDDTEHDGRYIKGYTRKSRPKTYSGLDLDKLNYNRKIKAWENLNIHVATPSNWMAEEAKRSKLFKSKTIQVIHNCINTKQYRPLGGFSRNVLNFPDDKKILLFGAMNSMSNPRKGFDLLRDSLKELKQKGVNNLELVIFGASESRDSPDFGFPTHYMGRVYDDLTLSMLYSAVDIMVTPSRQDNLPNTVVESMSCGTPVVAFDIGGMRDMIDHKVNGYIAKPFDSKDFANGIEWLLSDKNKEINFSNNARSKSVENFSEDRVVNKYLRLYEKAVNENTLV